MYVELRYFLRYWTSTEKPYLPSGAIQPKPKLFFAPKPQSKATWSNSFGPLILNLPLQPFIGKESFTLNLATRSLGVPIGNT